MFYPVGRYDDWERRLTPFFPSVYLEETSTSGNFTNETNCKFNVKAPVKVFIRYQRLKLYLFKIFVMM